MSKRDAIAYARALREEKEAAVKAATLKADLDALRAVRQRFSGNTRAYELIDAIDTFAGRLCGDRRVFWSQNAGDPPRGM